MKKILTALCLLATAGAWAAPQLIAHRGGTGDAPENTLPAIKLALENNAEAIWVTVQLSRDGVPVLYRSSDLSALTNSEGKVSGLTAAELAKVDAGWKWGDDSHPWRGKQATIPTLQSVLQQAGDRIEILLGGGVHADNAEEIQNTFNVNQLHGTRIVSF